MTAISGDHELVFGEVVIKKLNFSSVAYAAQTDDIESGPSKFAETINQTDLDAGIYEGTGY